MDFKVLGISAAMGVSLYPFKKNLIGNLENRAIFHTPKSEQWKANFGDIPLWRDEDKMERAIKKEKVDVIISSPDCGSGSIFRLSRAKSLGDHKKNDSLALFFRAIKKYKPKFFYFENLDGLFKSFPEHEFKGNLGGYRLVIHNASVSYWGNSQETRKRLIVIGIRKDLPKKLRKFFKLPNYQDQIKTCGELYGDLTESDFRFGHIREEITDVISIYARKKASLFEIQKEWNTRLEGKKRWLVEGGNFKTAPGVYRNLFDDYPATARKANRQYDHNGLQLTPRQLARVQGVPDDFKLHLDLKNRNYWINKARAAVTKTPPYEISVWFKQQLKKCYKYANNIPKGSEAD